MRFWAKGHGILTDQRTKFGAIFWSVRATSARPITDLKTHAKDVVEEAVRSGEPILITQNGRARVVVMDARRHDDMQATLSMLKLLAQSQESLARGAKTHSSEDVRQRAHAALRRAARR